MSALHGSGNAAVDAMRRGEGEGAAAEHDEPVRLTDAELRAAAKDEMARAMRYLDAAADRFAVLLHRADEDNADEIESALCSIDYARNEIRTARKWSRL